MADVKSELTMQTGDSVEVRCEVVVEERTLFGRRVRVAEVVVDVDLLAVFADGRARIRLRTIRPGTILPLRSAA